MSSTVTTPSATTLSVATPSAAIRTRGLTRRYGELCALDHLDLEVARGEMFGLVGPDGAGKSTTIRLLCGIARASEGRVEVAGCDVTADPESVKRRIGYMSQSFTLYGDLTVDENVDFFANIHGVSRGERRRRKQELLRATSLAPARKRLAERLSGGMKQKLGLVCTLVHEPEVLLLDEPTTGVDPLSRREFWAILHRLLGQGMTILMSTPYMDEAERCSRVGLLDHGRLIACDTPAALRARFGGEMLQVRGVDLRLARLALDGCQPVLSTQLFGDRLHVTVGCAASAAPAVVALLAAAGLAAEVRPSAPDLEDVFVALTRSAGDVPGVEEAAASGPLTGQAR
jgi:ABC-2 type transport system ATP-binding protein